MAHTKISNQNGKVSDKTLLDAFMTTFGSLQKQIQNIQCKAPMTEKKILKGSKKLMLKPPGSAGKSTGYNLQEAMGLDKKVHQYNYYLKSVRSLSKSVLELRKTWRQQPMALRVQVVGLAQEKHLFLQKFAYGWPIADMMKQYLVNSKCYAKQLGDGWDPDPGDEGEAGEDNEGEDEPSEDEESEDDEGEDEPSEDKEGEDDNGEDEPGKDDEDEDKASEDENEDKASENEDEDKASEDEDEDKDEC